ncbi:hypothetical protein [Bradyrhizobium sp. LMTR 3]|uniref:hypothetical protein n=1 Tax=Bradyrhizobium sp. LMTR 3 TaxID=189873 RepID=UPI00159F181C|nr:hypothetical protein [Bradyrhizobium sp. LMTR 3]
MHIEVQLTRDDVVEAVPRIEVPALPHLAFHFPHISLPDTQRFGQPIAKINCRVLRSPLKATNISAVTAGI